MSAYTVKRITPKQSLRSYALVRLIDPSIGVDDWLRYVRAVLMRRRLKAPPGDDIVVAADALGYVRGLALTLERSDPDCGRVLDVPVFLVASAVDERGVREELLRHLRDKGLASGCQCVRLLTRTPRSLRNQLAGEVSETPQTDRIISLGA